MQYITYSGQETLDLGYKIGKKLNKSDIIALNGDLGAGKTVIAKGIALALNVKEDVTSPTYNIICEYNGDLPFYHFDLYRISNYEEFALLGAEELVYGNGVSVIEWWERIEDELDENIIHINITIDPVNKSRLINIEGLEL